MRQIQLPLSTAKKFHKKAGLSGGNVLLTEAFILGNVPEAAKAIILLQQILSIRISLYSAVPAPAGSFPASTAKVNKSAWTKKLKKQLEGLELAAKLIQDLLRAGLGTMGGTALDTYRQLSKQLGDYYLPGPQRLLNGLILEIEEFQKDGEDAHYDKAIRILEELWALVKKSREYLSGKLERGEIGLDESPLYEDLGGVWKLSELEGLTERSNSGCF